MKGEEPAVDVIGDLARALCRRDGAAARGLEPEARRRLNGFCAGYLGDADAAEDVVQEALARLIAEETEPAAPRPWLLRVARNLCLDRLRRRQGGPDFARLASSFDTARETAGPISRLIGAEADGNVQRALEALSGEERELLRLRYAEDLPRAEVAAVVDLPEKLVKSRLFEAVQKLRRELGPPS